MVQAQSSEQIGEQKIFLKSTDKQRREEGEPFEIPTIILGRMSISIDIEIGRMFINIPKVLFHLAQEGENRLK